MAERLEFQLTEADLVRFHLHYTEHSPRHRRTARRHRLLVPAVYLVLSGILTWTGAHTAAALFAAFGLAWIAFSPALLRRRYRRAFARHVREAAGDSLREPMTVELCEDGIHTHSFNGQSVYRYAAVDRVETSDTHTFVFIGKAMGIIIPHDRTDAAARAGFLAALEQRRAAAVTPPAVPSA